MDAKYMKTNDIFVELEDKILYLRSNHFKRAIELFNELKKRYENAKKETS